MHTHSTANTHKMTTIHSRQLQKYTQDGYNNIQKTTTRIHTRQLRQYTQDNYKNTYKTPTAIHTGHLTTMHARQLQQYTQDKNNNYTQDNLKLATIHGGKLEYNMYRR